LRIVLLAIFALILLAMSVVIVSGFVYGMNQHMAYQTLVIANLNIKSSALGNIEEGQTKTFDNATIPGLGSAATLVTTKDHVCLLFESNVGILNSSFSEYAINIKFASVGSGSSYSVGDVANTINLMSPAIMVTLDKAGVWSFDLEIIITAKSVSSDQAMPVTIKVTAESS
jgi:hypothetical protein